MVPVWMIFNDLFKVTIIQSQITWKWYNIQLYLQWPSGRPIESRIWSIERRHFFNDLEPPLPPVSRLRRSLTLNISEVRHTVRHTFNGGTYRRSTQHCHFEWPWVILSDLAKYSAIQSARGFSPTAEFLVSQAVITKLYFRINFVNSSWTLSKLGDKACCDVNFLKFLPRPGMHALPASSRTPMHAVDEFLLIGTPTCVPWRKPFVVQVSGSHMRHLDFVPRLGTPHCGALREQHSSLWRRYWESRRQVVYR